MVCTDLLSHDQAVVLLKQRVDQYPTVTKAAAAMNVSSPYLSDVLKGRRDIGPTLANALGIRRIIAFRHIEESPAHG